MKKTIYYKKTSAEPYTDVLIPRCPDIQSFHYSLDRIFGENYDFQGEIHDFYEMVYVLSGTVGITAGDKVYSLDAGQCLMHPPNEFHRIRSEKGSEPHVLNLSFHATAMPTYDGRIFTPNLKQQEEFLQISATVRDGLRHSDAVKLNEQRLCLEGWLLHAIQSATDHGIVESSAAVRYAEIVNVLQEHLHEPLSATEVARLCNMSLSNLKKIFTKYAGMGVSRYFTEMKMRRAAVLLQSGKRVGEVAAELGFADQNYFSTVFHRIMGVPPGHYRG